jgi:hypothetical protein
MKPAEIEALINARSSTVWDVITDAGNYTVWDSGITHIEGDVRNGSSIRIRTHTGGNRTFRLRVRQIPGEVMTWTGGLPFGLLSLVRTFVVTPEAGMTHLLIREELSGPLAGLLRKRTPDMTGPLTDYVWAVKRRAEIIG